VIFFFDTSALIKRYLHEKGSARVRRLLQTGGAIFYQTFLTPVEMTSALIGLLGFIEFIGWVAQPLNKRNQLQKP